MRYKVIYENNRGQRVNLSERPYFLNIEPILDYQWSYSEKEKRRGNIIAGFAKDIQSVDLTLHIMDANAEARDEAVDYFNNVIEADIYDGIAGRLIIGDWYTWGYIIASKNTKWQYGNPVVKKVVKLVREQENWYHVVQKANYGSEQAEELYNFVEEDIKTYEGADTNSLKSLTATINPKQDLHGYDKPWVGGAGKNKLEVTSSSNTSQGITATVNSDGSITVNGTATGTYIYTVNNTLVLDGNYILSGCPTGGSAGTYRMDCYWSGQGALIDSGNGVAISPNGNAVTTRIIVMQGVTVNNLVFKPMIRLASETDATYEPYSNICPISGWESVDVTRSGKNLLPQQSDAIQPLFIPSGTQIFVSATPPTNSLSCVFNFYRADKSRIDYWTLNQSVADGRIGKNVTITEDTYYVAITNATALNKQIEFGTAATVYEPYQADTYHTSLPETVYGGSLDVVNGVLVIEKEYYQYNNINTTSGKEVDGGWRCDFRCPNGDINRGKWSVQVPPTLSMFDGSKPLNNGGISKGYAADSYTAIVPTATSKETAEAMLEGLQIVYNLAEPRTIQLTPKQVTTLLGANNVWADSGDVTVEYWDDAGRIKTASGSVVTFSKHNSMSGAGYDYPYDYMADVQSQKRIENPNSVPCDFSITIQGYVDRPEVQIGDNVIAFDLEVPYGAFLTVDSSKKTAIMTLADGAQVNVFGARDPDYYLFEKIKEGKNTVTWNGSFLWEIKMLEERSEPRWRMD